MGGYFEIKNSRLFGGDGEKFGELKVYQLSPEELAKYQEEDDKMVKNIPTPPREELINLITEKKGNMGHMATAKSVGWTTMQKWIKHHDLMAVVGEARNAVQQVIMAKRAALNQQKEAGEPGESAELTGEPIGGELEPEVKEHDNPEVKEPEAIGAELHYPEVEEHIGSEVKDTETKYPEIEYPEKKAPEVESPKADELNQKPGPEYIILFEDEENLVFDCDRYKTTEEVVEQIRNNYALSEIDKVKLFVQIPFRMDVSVKVGSNG